MTTSDSFIIFHCETISNQFSTILPADLERIIQPGPDNHKCEQICSCTLTEKALNIWSIPKGNTHTCIPTTKSRTDKPKIPDSFNQSTERTRNDVDKRVVAKHDAKKQLDSQTGNRTGVPTIDKSKSQQKETHSAGPSKEKQPAHVPLAKGPQGFSTRPIVKASKGSAVLRSEASRTGAEQLAPIPFTTPLRPPTRLDIKQMIFNTLAYLLAQKGHERKAQLSRARYELFENRIPGTVPTGINWNYWCARWGSLIKEERWHTARKEILPKLSVSAVPDDKEQTVIEFQTRTAPVTMSETPSQRKTMNSLLEQKQAGFISADLFERLRERCGLK